MSDIRFTFDDATSYFSGDGPALAGLRGALPGHSLPLSDGQSLFVADHDRARAIVSNTEARVLANSDAFLAPDVQAEEVAIRTGLSPADARQLLDGLAARGLLVAPAQLIGEPVPALPRLPDPLVAIRTCNRPLGLARLLDSLVAEQKRLGRTRRFLVCDDARSASERAVNRAEAQRFARASGAIVHYVGADERRALGSDLLAPYDARTRAALDTLLRFESLDTATGARSWNWAVLLSAGGSLSLLDDDFLFPVRHPLDSGSRLELYDSLVAETRYFDDDGWRLRPTLEGDPFAAASRYVGQPTRALVGSEDTRWEMDGAPVSDLALVAPGRRVLGAGIGVYGTLGHDSAAYLALAGPKTMQDLWREPFRIERLEGESVWSGVRSPRLLSGLSATPFLLDNRELLPFAGSHGRVDDTFFLNLLTTIEPESAFVMLPLLIGHFPDEQRNRLANSRSALLTYSNTHAAGLMHSFGSALSGRDRARRLAAVGAMCSEHALASHDELAAIALARYVDRQVDYVRRLGERLAEHTEAPAEWREYAAGMLAANRAALATPRITDAEVAALQGALAQAGAAAAAWVDLWRRCRDQPPLERLAPLGAST